MNEQDNDKQALATELAQVAERILDESEKTWEEVVVESLYEILADPLLRKIKMRGWVENMLYQLGKVTSYFTTMANALEIEYGGKTVEPSSSWTFWNASKIEVIATHIITRIEHLTRSNASLVERLASLNSVYNAMQMKQSETSEKQQTTNRDSDARLEIAVAQRDYLAKQLACYHDQNCFIVARIDETTRKPIRFYRATMTNGQVTKISNVATVEEASYFNDLRTAKDLRSLIVRGLRRKLGVAGHKVSDLIVILQDSLYHVEINIDVERGDEE